jgi:hypothetical protein
MYILKILSYIFLPKMSQEIQYNQYHNKEILHNKELLQYNINIQELKTTNIYKKLTVVIPENYGIIAKPKPTIISPLSFRNSEEIIIPKKQTLVFTFAR